MKGLIGKKVGMTQLYDDKGVLTPVTVVQAGPCVVVDVKNVERDGYSAVLFGFGSRKAKNAGKAVAGQAAKAGVNTPSIMKEFRITDDSKFEIGAEIGAGIFEEGEYLDVTGVTKGRGYQGVMVRFHFKGGRDGHGGGWHRKRQENARSARQREAHCAEPARCQSRFRGKSDLCKWGDPRTQRRHRTRQKSDQEIIPNLQGNTI